MCKKTKNNKKKKKHCVESPYIKSPVDRLCSLYYCTKIISEGSHSCWYTERGVHVKEKKKKKGTDVFMYLQALFTGKPKNSMQN